MILFRPKAAQLEMLFLCASQLAEIRHFKEPNQRSCTSLLLMRKDWKEEEQRLAPGGNRTRDLSRFCSRYACSTAVLQPLPKKLPKCISLQS